MNAADELHYKSLSPLFLVGGLQLLFTLVVGALFTLMLFFGKPVSET